jgi:uncharacterized phage-associated protein
MLRFTVDAKKVVNTILFFAGRCTDPTKMKISKLMFYADKLHLNKYGRPVTGDSYIKMRFGPVPSMALNLMRQQAYYESASELFDHSVSVKGNNIIPLVDFDRGTFSRSDIAVLEEVLATYGAKSAATLSEASHVEPAWCNAAMNRKIDFEQFFDSDEDSQRMLRLLAMRDEATQEHDLDEAARAYA